jgi:ABC-type sugar transport system permease subunit
VNGNGAVHTAPFSRGDDDMKVADTLNKGPGARVRGSRRRVDSIGYAMIAPGFLIYFLFIFIPVVVGLYFSLTSYNFSGSPQFIGLNNFIGLFHDSIFLVSIYNTFIYALFTIVPQLIVGLLLAVGLNGALKGRALYRASIYLPHVTSMVAISMVWLWMYEPSLGVFNRTLNAMGFPMVAWLTDPNTAMGSIIVMSIWRSLGFNMIVYLSGLQNIPSSLYEAAKVDGAGSLQRLWLITIPMLNPTTFFLLVTNCINSFMVFEQVNVMTGGGPLDSTTTIVHQIYLTAFLKFRMGYAMSMAMILFLIVTAITALNFKIGNQGQDLDVD